MQRAARTLANKRLGQNKFVGRPPGVYLPSSSLISAQRAWSNICARRRVSLLRNFCPRYLTFISEPDPVADRQRDPLPLEHTELPCLVKWQLLLDAAVTDDDSSLLPAKDFPLFAAFKARFMTIDRQLKHWWVCIRAWRDGGSSRLLLYTMVMAEDELRALQLTYRVEDRYVFQDSAYDTTQVYTACAKYGWIAVLGSDENAFQHPKKDIRGRSNNFEYKLYSRIRDIAIGQTKCRLILLATERLKDIAAHLRDGKSLPWEIPSDVPELYLKQINGEVKKETVEPKTKRAVFRWLQVKPNHAFDTEYYQVAAALIAGILRLD